MLLYWLIDLGLLAPKSDFYILAPGNSAALAHPPLGKLQAIIKS